MLYPAVKEQLAESNKCHISCGQSSFEDGECGGQNHFSAYEACMCFLCSETRP